MKGFTVLAIIALAGAVVVNSAARAPFSFFNPPDDKPGSAPAPGRVAPEPEEKPGSAPAPGRAPEPEDASAPAPGRAPEPEDWENWHPVIDLNNPEFQKPDLILSEEQKAYFFGGAAARQAIDLRKYGGNKWPGAKVPYVFRDYYSSADKAKIRAGMKMIEDTTCIRFVPRSTEKDYVSIYKGDGCHSRLGKMGGRQDMSLADNCPQGTVAHEFMHTLGVMHQHCRTDRDDYVTINWQNIPPDWTAQYEKVDPPEAFSDYGSKYEYGSIMHYPASGFGNGDAITAKQPGGERLMGQRERMAPTDIAILNAMYC